MASTIKTKVTKVSVTKFLAQVPDSQRREDAKVVARMMEAVTKERPKLWGSSIVGFGQYHYKSERSSQEGDWPMMGFSPRKAALTIYIMPGLREYKALLARLGPHKISGGSCLYLKRLSDVDQTVLKKIIARSFAHMKKKYA